jgi:hypothetical protein
MSGYVYPAYVPARHLGGNCTDALVLQYYTDCSGNNNCAVFLPGGANEACGACMSGTPVAGSSTYGPVLTYGSTSVTVSETNLAGCLELMGEANCAAKYQLAQLCVQYACADSCPIIDQTSYSLFAQCQQNARTTVCANQVAATTCITNPTDGAACSGADFQAQFLAIGHVFCVDQH